MFFAAHASPPALRPYVGAAHGYRMPANPTGLHRGLPSRHLTLVIELHAPLHIRGLAHEVTAHGVLGGLHTRPALLDASRPQEGLHYALTVRGARALLGVEAADLRDDVVDLEAVLGAEAGRLVDRLAGEDSWARRFRLLDHALLARLSPTTPASPQVARAWRLIHASDGRVRVADVAAQVGWSRRHLADRFRRATGLTPKEAARIARFESARRLFLAPGRPGLAHVAVRCGYADQPHLAREWQALAGCSPGTWLREELPFVQDTHPPPHADSPA